MVCKTCGRNIENENVNFCENCGTSLRKSYLGVEQESTYQNISHINNNETSEGEEKNISFSNWIGSLLLPFIPFIGILVYIVMLFVWSFSSGTPKTKKNWARAQLIVTIVTFVLVILFIVYAVVTTLNGTSMEEFYKTYSNLYNK